MFFQFHRELYYKEIPENLFDNLFDAEKDVEAKEFRLNNVTSYMPTPGPINQVKFRKRTLAYHLRRAAAFGHQNFLNHRKKRRKLPGKKIPSGKIRGKFYT